MKWSIGWNKDGRHFEVRGSGQIGAIVIEEMLDLDVGTKYLMTAFDHPIAFEVLKQTFGLTDEELESIRYYAEDYLLQNDEAQYEGAPSC